MANQYTKEQILGEVPGSYEELVERWYPRMRRMAQSFLPGATREDLEDAVSDLVADFIEGNYLEIYDPTKARFGTFMYHFMIRRLKGKKDQYWKERNARVTMELQETHRGQELEHSGTSAGISLETIMIKDDNEIDAIGNYRADVERLSQKLRNYDDRKARKDPRRKLEKLWLLIAEMSLESTDGVIDRKELAKRMELSESTVSLMICELQSIPEVVALLFGQV